MRPPDYATHAVGRARARGTDRGTSLTVRTFAHALQSRNIDIVGSATSGAWRTRRAVPARYVSWLGDTLATRLRICCAVGSLYRDSHGVGQRLSW